MKNLFVVWEFDTSLPLLVTDNYLNAKKYIDSQLDNENLTIEKTEYLELSQSQVFILYSDSLDTIAIFDDKKTLQNYIDKDKSEFDETLNVSLIDFERKNKHESSRDGWLQ